MSENQFQLTDAQIYGEFPELRDWHSELFKVTARIYRNLFRRNPEIKHQPEALYRAAQAARECLKGEDLGPEAKAIIKELGVSEAEFRVVRDKIDRSRKRGKNAKR